LGGAPKSAHTRRPLHRQDWVAPPTKMDESELIKEGHYAAFYLQGGMGGHFFAWYFTPGKCASAASWV